MTKDQIRFAMQYAGVDPDNLESVKQKIRIIWMDNAGHYFHDNADKNHILVEIDYVNELVVIEELHKGFPVMAFSPFDTIQKLVFKSDRVFDSPYQRKFID